MNPLSLPETRFSFRRAGPEDLEGIMDLEVRGFPPGVVEQAEVFRTRLEVFPEGFLLLELEGESGPQGYLTAELWEAKDPWSDHPFELNHDLTSVLNRDGTLLYIASMTVSSELRGRGVGSAFFRSALSHLLSEFPRVEEVWLIVGEKWSGAEKIYRSCGFSEVGRLTDFLRPEGESPQAVLVMNCPRRGLHL